MRAKAVLPGGPRRTVPAPAAKRVEVPGYEGMTGHPGERRRTVPAPAMPVASPPPPGCSRGTRARRGAAPHRPAQRTRGCGRTVRRAHGRSVLKAVHHYLVLSLVLAVTGAGAGARGRRGGVVEDKGVDQLPLPVHGVLGRVAGSQLGPPAGGRRGAEGGGRGRKGLERVRKGRDVAECGRRVSWQRTTSGMQCRGGKGPNKD